MIDNVTDYIYIYSNTDIYLIYIYIYIYYFNHMMIGRKSELALQSIQQMMFINLFYGCTMKNIDNWAHIGGFISGILLGYLLGPRKLKIKSNYLKGNNNWRVNTLFRTKSSMTSKMNNNNVINSNTKLTFNMKCTLLYYQLKLTFYKVLYRIGIMKIINKTNKYSDYNSKYNNYQPYNTHSEYGNLLDD